MYVHYLNFRSLSNLYSEDKKKIPIIIKATSSDLFSSSFLKKYRLILFSDLLLPASSSSV